MQELQGHELHIIDERNILVNGPSLTEMGVVTTGSDAAVDSFITGRIFSDNEP